MSQRPPFASISDVETRFPRDFAVLIADEQTRLRDEPRAVATLAAVSVEIRGILAQRYSAAELDGLDDDGRALLRTYAVEMAPYKLALSFGKSAEKHKEFYDSAVRRLEAIAAGKGGLSFVSVGSEGSGTIETPIDTVGANEVVMTAPERVFTRRRFGAGS